MEHVEVLRDLSEVCRAAIKAGDWKVDGSCDPDSLLSHADAAIASLSAPQPPAEAQPVAHYCEHRHKCKWHADGAWPSFGTGEGRAQAWKDAHAERCGGRILPLYAHPPPSAPVGVEAALRDALQGLIDFIEIDNLPMDADAMFIAKRALAQQPAPVAPAGVEGLPERWRREAPQAGVDSEEDAARAYREAMHWCAFQLEEALAQQPAAVDSEMVTRAVNAYDEATGEGWQMPCLQGMRAALTAALAAQQGGVK